MALFTGYFDESDTERAGVVAGCLFNVEQLPFFEREWRDLLAGYDLSAFHMKDFVHSNGQFSSWKGKEALRRDFIKRVVGIISRRANISVGTVVDSADFDAFVCTSRRKEFFKNVYTTASYLCLLTTGRWAEMYGHAAPIAFVFDQGNQHRHDFENAFLESWAIPELRSRYRLGSLTFEDDVEIVAIQAADFIAYEMSKFWTEHRSESGRNPRASLLTAMDSIVNEWRVATPALFEKIAHDAGVP